MPAQAGILAPRPHRWAAVSVARRPAVVAAIGIGLLAVALVAGIAAGSVAIAPGDTLGILTRRLLGLNIVPTQFQRAERIFII